ncbi:hypothetical protein BJ165DRAFT_1535237 [Panaeolus papilionaceus]|nr:hypothetical protein BJ165DRAFT_1535237 [Panaeolus papilionaceus]
MSDISQISDEVFLLVLSYLAPRLELKGLAPLDTDPLKSSHYTGNADIVNCMLVCKQWKLVCISNSAFWTVYPCCNTDFDISKIERHIQYSKGSQLELRFDMRSLTPHCVQFCQQIISQESGRIMTLHLELGEYDHLPTILSSQFPSLRTLVCHQMKYVNHEPVVFWPTRVEESRSFMDSPPDWSRFPRLNSFSLTHPMNNIPIRITGLHLQHVDVNILVPILEQSPLLQSLGVVRIFDKTILNSIDPPRFTVFRGWTSLSIVRHDGFPVDLISLPHLTHLSIWGDQVLSILKDCPLESLEAVNFSTPMEKFLGNSPTRITRLKFHQPRSWLYFTAISRLMDVDTVIISFHLHIKHEFTIWVEDTHLSDLLSRVRKVRLVAIAERSINTVSPKKLQKYSDRFWNELGSILYRLDVCLESWDVLGPVQYPKHMRFFKPLVVWKKYGRITLNDLPMYPKSSAHGSFHA